jgi:hypothetical protein
LILISSCRSIGLLPLLHAGVRLGVQFSKSADLEKPTERGTHVRVGSKCEILATSRYFLLMARDQTLAVRRTPCAGNGRRATLQAVDLRPVPKTTPARRIMLRFGGVARLTKKNPPFCGGSKFREEPPTWATRACVVCGNSYRRYPCQYGVRTSPTMPLGGHRRPIEPFSAHRDLQAYSGGPACARPQLLAAGGKLRAANLF